VVKNERWRERNVVCLLIKSAQARVERLAPVTLHCNSTPQPLRHHAAFS